MNLKYRIAAFLLYTALIVVITLWLRGCAVKPCPELVIKHDTVFLPSQDSLKTIAKGKLTPKLTEKKKPAKTSVDTSPDTTNEGKNQDSLLSYYKCLCDHYRIYDTAFFKIDDYDIRLKLKADCEDVFIMDLQHKNLKPDKIITREVILPKPQYSKYSLWLGASAVESDRLTASGDIMLIENQSRAYKYSYNPFLKQHTAGVVFKIKVK